MSTMIIIGYCAGSAMLALMLIALVYAIVVPTPDRWSKNYFITFFSLLTVCVLLLCLHVLLRKARLCAGGKDLLLYRVPVDIRFDADTDVPAVAQL